MSENELDRDYSYLEGRRVNWLGRELTVYLIEYDMGITMIDENKFPSVCLRNTGLDENYDRLFLTMIELIEHGKVDDVLRDMWYSKTDKTFIGEHNSASACPFYGG